MKQAIELARRNVNGSNGGPFGAVVVKDGKVIAEGNNQVTSLQDPTAHAEVQAIRKACQALGTFDLSGCEIYSSCEPCPMCLGAIYWARPARVYFGATRQDAARAGFDDDLIYSEINVAPERRKIPMKQIRLDETDSVFSAWNSKEDKIRY
ncbi:MAG: nucleoside deaminase [Deltaproteobacteria bacterium]|nr:nucleoside deaminase [Deltaproteobacteria bacterium]